MTEALFTSPVKDGKVTGDTALRIRQMLALYEGKEVEISLKEVKKRVTQSQRGYFHGVIVPQYRLHFHNAGHTYDDSTVRHYLARYVGKLTRTFVGPDDKEYEHVKSVESLTKEEMSDFIEICLQHAAEIGLMIRAAGSK